MIENPQQHHELSDDQRRDCLRLIRSENVGPVTFYNLLERYGSAAAALDALPELARNGGRRHYRIYPKDKAERELDNVRSIGAHFVAWCEPNYPPALRHIDGAPPLLTILGNPSLFQKRAVAVVGARNASANGLGFTRKLAAELGHGGFGCDELSVVSGMARGIDTAAHHGSLEKGTIAVLGGGVDVIYPKENERLYMEIAERGVIVAEMAAGTEPSARLFPIRNRIIAGISSGVVVVEASPRSGSLITARLALEQGREVFAVPGAPGDPRAKGTNGLIREGAILTESASDVLHVLGEQKIQPPNDDLSFDLNAVDTNQTSAAFPVSNRDEIKELLGNSPVAVDELARNCQFSIATVHAVLLELELAGQLERHPGNRVCLIVEHEQTRKPSPS